MTKRYDLERRVTCAFVAGMFLLAPTLPASAATNTTPATAPTASTTTNGGGSTATPNLSNLDLTSRNKSVTTPYGGTIREGAKNVSFNPGDLVTPAQAMALSQLVQNGTQSLILNTLGTAIGGSFRIAGSSIDSLVIPRGVTGLGNFSTGSALNLTGNLSNSGKFYLFSTDSAYNTAAISAQNIYNNVGGLVSSVLPTSLLASLGGIPSLNIDLSAINNIVNAGIIRSSGSLSLTAGNSIINALPSGIAGPSPVMQAATNLNLTASNIVNAGLITSLTSNINLAGVNAGSLTVNNAGGTMKALLGNINVRDALFGAKSNFNLLGGELLSKQLNVFTGDGVANITAKEISGLVNINAGVAHVAVDKGNLQLGEMNITGDPTFYNKGGDVTLSSDFSFPGVDLAIVASRNIISTAGGVDITTANTTTGDAGVITLVAGAQFAIPSTAPDSGSFNDGSTLSIFSGSATGGKIDLKTNQITSLDAHAVNGNGGNILMVAYKGSAAGSGTIALPSTLTIQSSGSASQTNGDVTMIAGATAGTGISLGAIDTSSGGGGTGGAISLVTATPTIVVDPSAGSNASITVDIVDGAFKQYSALFAAGATTAAGISLGTSATNTASSFTATTKGAFTTGVGGDIIAGGTASHLDGGLVSINAGSVNLHNVTANGNSTDGKGGTITVVTTGALGLNGNISANAGAGATTGDGGIIQIAGGTISGTNVLGIGISANAAGDGDGGSILVNSSGAVKVGPGAPGVLHLSATGGSSGSASGDGGTIQVNSGSNLTVIDPSAIVFGPQGNNGKGGTLILDAGFKTAAGNLLINGAIFADGVGTGNGGSIQLYSKSATVFDVEGPATKNGVTGSISANAGNGAGANGGSIFIENSGTGGIKVDPGQLSVTGSVAGGDGGDITIYAGNATPNLTASGIDIDFNRTIPAIIGSGFITSNLAATGAVTILGGTLDASGSALGGGSGGTIGIIGKTVTNTGNLTIKASGSDAGSGGGIYIGTTNVNAGITVGGATNTLTLNASSGINDGNGGTIALKATQGNINIDTSGISLAPAAGGTGNGGTLQLAAGDSKSTADRNVFISGNMSDLNGATGGNGGKLFVVTNSSKAFTFGGATTGGNGFQNPITALAGATSNGTNGTMLFSNYHRNLAGAAFDPAILTTAESNVTGAVSASGGTVALMDLASDNVEAKSAVTINVPGGTYDLSATGTGPSGGNGGNLILEANSFTGFTTSGPGLTVNLNASDVGHGGTLVIRETSPTSSLALNSSNTANTLNVQAKGGTTSGNGGAVYVGAGNVDASDLSAFNVGPAGTNGNGGSLAFIAQKTLTLNPGTYNLNGAGTGNGGNISLAGSNDINLTYSVDGTNGGSVAANSSGGNVSLMSLGSAGQTVFASSAKGTFDLTAAGGLFLAGAIKSGKDMAITATNGDITTGSIDTNTAVLTTPTKLTLTASTGSIGFFDQSNIDNVVDQRVLTATPHLIVTSGGTAQLAPGVAAGAYISNKGSLSLDDASADNTSGALMISTSGNLTVPTGGSPISANNIYLRTSAFSNGNVILNRQIGTSTNEGSIVQISADGKGNITQGAGAYNLRGDIVLLDFESYVPDDLTQPAPNGNIGTAAAPIRVQGVTHPSVTVNTTTWLNNPIDPLADTVNLGSLTFGKGIYIAVNGDADLSNFFDVEGTLNVTTSANANSTGNLIVTSQLATLGGGKSNNIVLNAANNFYLAALGAVGFSDSLNVFPGPPPVAFIEPGSTVHINAGGSILSTMYAPDPSLGITDAGARGVIRGHNVYLNAGGTIGLADSAPNAGTFPKVSAAASNLYLNAPNGSAYINGEDIPTLSFLPINLKQVNLAPTGSNLELFSFRPIVVAAAIPVDKVDLEVYQGLVGDITLNANVGNAGVVGGFTKLSADSTSNIIQNAGKILSPNVILGGMTTGNIGSKAHPINTAADTITVGTFYDPNDNSPTAVGAPHTGDTYINNTSASLTLQGGGQANSGPLQSGGVLSVKNTGSIIIPAGNPLEVSATASGTFANGVTASVSIPFKITSASQIQVYDYDNTAQTATLIPAANYTVNLATSTVHIDTGVPANNHSIVVVRTTSPSISLTTVNGDITIGDNIIANHNVVDARVFVAGQTTPVVIPAATLTESFGTSNITSNVTLNAGGTGNVFTTGGVIQGDNVSITTNTGSIGQNGTPLTIGSPQANGTATITATTRGATSSIYINTSTASTINGAVADTVSLVANSGAMTLNGTIGKLGTTTNPTDVSIASLANNDILAGTKVNVLGTNIALNANGIGELGSGTQRIKLSPKGSLSVVAEKAFLQTTAATNLGGGVTVTDTFDLLSAGAITGSVDAPNITLKTTAGSIGTSASSRFTVGASATNLNFTSARDVFVNDTASGASVATGSSRGAFDVVAGTNLTLNNVTASRLINAADTAGGVTLSGTVKAPTVTLSTLGQDITGSVAAGTLSASAGAGNINLTNAGRLTLAGASGNSVSITTTGSAATLTVKGNVTGTNIALNANGNIALNAQVGNAGGGSTVSLATTGTGAITRTSTGVINGDSISLQTAGGAIGSAAMPITTVGTGTTPLLKAGLTGGTGNVYLSSSTAAASGTNFSELPGTSFPGSLTITDSSPVLTLSGAINVGTINTKSTSNLVVKETSGHILVQNNGYTTTDANGIFVTGGSITLQAVDPTKTITFDTNSQVKTNVAANTSVSNGVVKVVVGPKVPTAAGQVLNSANNVTVVKVGLQNPILATGSNQNPFGSGVGAAQVKAKGRSVIVSTVNAGSIILNAANVEADPPVTTAAAGLLHHTVAQPSGSAQAPAQRLGSDRGRSEDKGGSVDRGGSAGGSQNTAAQELALAVPSIPQSVISTATARDTVQPKVLTGGVTLDKHSAESTRSGQAASRTPQLESGATILAPDHDIVVSTPYGPLKVGEGAIVLSILNGDGLAIYDLHDDHLGDVALGHSDAAVELHPGSHAFITRSAKDYEMLNPLTFIAHRDLKSTERGGATVHTSEFSITSALSANGPLSGLLRSSNGDERRIMSRLLKDAAILMQTKAAQGQYKRITPAGLSLAN